MANSSNQSICDMIIAMQLLDNNLLYERVILVVYVGTCVAICSMVMNGLLSLIFHRARDKKPRTYLTAISIADTAFAVIYMTLIAGGLAKDYFKILWLHVVWMKTFRVQFTLGRILRVMQTYLVTVAAIEKAIDVWHESTTLKKNDRHTHRSSRHRRAQLFVAIVVILSIAEKFPTYWEFVSVYNPECQGFAQLHVSGGVLTMHAEYDQYKLYAGPTLSFYIPLLLIILSYGYVVFRLRANLKELIQNKLNTSTSIISDLAGSMVYTMGIHKHAEPSKTSRHRSSTTATSTELKDNSKVPDWVHMHNNARSARRKALHAKTRLDLQHAVTDIQTRRVRETASTTAVVTLTYLAGSAIDVAIAFIEQYDVSLLTDNYGLYTIITDVSSVIAVLAGALRLPLYCMSNTAIRHMTYKTLCTRRRRRRRRAQGASSYKSRKRSSEQFEALYDQIDNLETKKSVKNHDNDAIELRRMDSGREVKPRDEVKSIDELQPTDELKLVTE